MLVKSFFHEDSNTFSYVVIDTTTNACAVIDSVLDYDQDAAHYSTESADQIIAFVKEKALTVQWLLETHIHADHISASSYLQQQLGGRTAIGSGIIDVLHHWVPVFETDDDTALDGSQFDDLFADGERFQIGRLEVKVIHTPGHTPACVSYHIENALFVGDTLFAAPRGTARVDFPGGSAELLYNSIQKLYQLPDNTQVYLCHDYPEAGVEPQYCMTLAEQKQSNAMLSADTSLAEFKKKREQRDKILTVPKLILPSIQTNMRLGRFGAVSEHGTQFIKIPINKL